jgi:hypothetical protein
MSIIENTSSVLPDFNPTAVESLKMMLDYAIAEGDELQLPVFVLLLRMAKLELAKCARGDFHLNSAPDLAHDAEELVAP